MSRFNDIVKEDSELLKEGVVRDWRQIVTLKLTQISASLAMIFDSMQHGQETSDDGR